MIEALYDEPSGISFNYLRKASFSVLTDGYEPLLSIKKQEKPFNVSKDQILHVPSA